MIGASDGRADEEKKSSVSVCFSFCLLFQGFPDRDIILDRVGLLHRDYTATACKSEKLKDQARNTEKWRSCEHST